MSTKIRIKAGSIEVDYEGEKDFSIADIKDLFSHIETLFKGRTPDEPEQRTLRIESSPAKPHTHVSTIASKLNVKTARDLVLAAAAVLQIYEQKDSFTRGELTEKMKAAKKHYKASMQSNLSTTLQALEGTKLNRLRDGEYSLTDEEHERLEARLA
jgi:hypothetical protein